MVPQKKTAGPTPGQAHATARKKLNRKKQAGTATDADVRAVATLKKAAHVSGDPALREQQKTVYWSVML